MVTISNSQRDQAVRYLQALADMMESDNRTKVVNLCRLARHKNADNTYGPNFGGIWLSKKLEKKSPVKKKFGIGN